ncbi:MAG TPA: hypothetical protein VM186_07000 [Planctomycetota bacterium]|nr:hypothetical protein [Planctomycetota bacterium]
MEHLQMPTCHSPRIVRLNAQTMPPSAEERATLAALGGELVEVEGATDGGMGVERIHSTLNIRKNL